MEYEESRHRIGGEVDRVFEDVDSKWRGLAALGAMGAFAFAIGVAVTSWGIRSDLREATTKWNQDLAMMNREMSVLRADIATNRSNIATIQGTVNQLDLQRMVETVRRIDRELCLFRADVAGVLTPQTQTECSNR